MYTARDNNTSSIIPRERIIMFPQHATLHSSIVGYQDGVEFVPAAAGGSASPEARLVLNGWAFHWREAVRPVRYVRRDADNLLFYQELRLCDRHDVAEAYNRVAVRRCGWSETIVVPATVDPEDCPEQWLEMQLRSGEWVKFRDLVVYQEDDDEETTDDATEKIDEPSKAPLLGEWAKFCEEEEEGDVAAAAAAAAGVVAGDAISWTRTVTGTAFGTCSDAKTIIARLEDKLAALTARVTALAVSVAALEQQQQV